MTPKGYGGYDPVLPLDKLLLEELPPEGSLILGVYPDGKSAKDLQKAVANGQLPMTQISTRMRVLHLFGLALRTKTVRASGAVYQITDEGKKYLASWGSNSDTAVSDDNSG